MNLSTYSIVQLHYHKLDDFFSEWTHERSCKYSHVNRVETRTVVLLIDIFSIFVFVQKDDMLPAPCNLQTYFCYHPQFHIFLIKMVFVSRKGIMKLYYLVLCTALDSNMTLKNV